jgi:hypothetical protein
MVDRRTYRYAVIGLSAGIGLFLIGVSVVLAVGQDVPKELWAFGTSLGGGLLGVLVPSPQATPGAKTVAESTTVQTIVGEAATKAAAEVAAAQAGGAHQAAHGQPAAQPDEVTEEAKQAAADVNSTKNLVRAQQATSAQPGLGAASAVLGSQHAQRALALETQAGEAGRTAIEKDGLLAQARVYKAAATAAGADATAKAAESAAATTPKGQASGRDYLSKLGPPTLVLLVTLSLGTLLVAGIIAPAHIYQQPAIDEGNGLLALAAAAAGALVGVLAPSPTQKKPANPG